MAKHEYPANATVNKIKIRRLAARKRSLAESSGEGLGPRLMKLAKQVPRSREGKLEFLQKSHGQANTLLRCPPCFLSSCQRNGLEITG